MLRMALISAAAFALTACATQTETASTEAPTGRDCFNGSSITGYNVVDDHNVRVSVGANRSYILTTDWNTRDLDWTHAIAVRSTAGWICTGSGLGVEIIGGEPRRTYYVQTVTRAPDAAPGSDQGS